MIINNERFEPIYLNDSITSFYAGETGKIFNSKTNNILTPYESNSGRYVVCLSVNGTNHVLPVHKLVYEAFYGKIPEDMTINHIDEDYTNNAYTNLELLTRSENIKEYLKNNGAPAKIYSDTVIEMICDDLKNGIYYKDVASAYNIPIRYIYCILKGKRRTFISSKYMPFPEEAFIKAKTRNIPHAYLYSLIKQGYSNKDIFELLGMDPSTANYKVLSKHRKKCGIKDPKYFNENLINSIDKYIISGLSNKEIYSLLNLEKSSRLSFLLTRQRKKLEISDFNPDGVSLSIQENIIDDIVNKLTNIDIFEKYHLERNYYTINMMARLRQKAKKKCSTNIENQFIIDK